MSDEMMQGYAGGGLIRELIEGVAKEAPEMARGARAASRRPVVNIGLDINGGEKLSPDEALSALEKIGVKPQRAFVAQSDSEPTLVVELDRSLDAEEASTLSAYLKQEAIAQVDEFGVGDLHGPSADKWKPFNGDYFIDSHGERLNRASIDDVIGEQQFAGGGLVKAAVEGLLDAAGVAEKKAMRLYHGTTKLPYPEGHVFDGKPAGAERGFDYLSPDVSTNQLGLHVGTPNQANYFGSGRENWDDADYLLNKEYFEKMAPTGGRVAPLDVTVTNPIRLEDRTGSWRPTDIYAQLVEHGKVPDDRAKMDWLANMEQSGDRAKRVAAMKAVREMIEDAGHDGVVYTNRVEGHPVSRDELSNRYYARGLDEGDMLNDQEWLDMVPEAQGNDSYIIWNKDQYKSPFGEGPGVGFAGGGVVRKLGQGLVDLLDFSGVSGRPSSVKIPGVGEVAAAPIAEIDDAAEAYMRKAGIPGTHRIDEYPSFDEDRARRLAEAYDAAKHAPNDPEVKRAYEALIDETLAQYKALEDTGLDVRFLKDGMDDPYAASPSMGYADMVNNGRLWVFPTSQGYGSLDDIADNPLLKRVGKVGDLEDATANDAFRVVHDAYGHFGPGNPFFRHAGEDRAWMHHGRMFSDDALPAMTAETRGQNSWLNFGPYGEQNRKALGADTIFADQKATIMPPWAYEEVRKRKFADGGPVMSDEDIASMTHDHSYGTGRDMNYLETLGTKIPLGEMNYYDVDGERRMPQGVQGIHDVARYGIYALPGAGPAIGTALDTTEAIADNDPVSAGMAVAFGPGGKLAKGAITSALAMGMDPAEAEAGMYGVLSKWGASKEGQAMLKRAMGIEKQGGTAMDTRDATGWFRDIDGHWKYELPSAGGSADLSQLKGSRLESVYDDPFLYDQHPELRDFTVRRVRDTRGAYFDPSNDFIGIGDISDPGFQKLGGVKGILDHEIYHKKASDHGWAPGTSKEAAKQAIISDMTRFLKDRSAPDNKTVGDYLQKMSIHPTMSDALPYARYEAEVGETLARREQQRAHLTKNGIMYKDPTRDIDIPREALFNLNEQSTPEQWRRLVRFNNERHEAEQVAKDMKNAGRR